MLLGEGMRVLRRDRLVAVALKTGLADIAVVVILVAVERVMAGVWLILM